MTLLLTHATQLLTLRGEASPRRGPAMRELGIINDGAVLIGQGKILAAGTTDDVARHRLAARAEEIDCRGKIVLPGFVDSHTHPAFTRPRLIDFEKRIAGASYEQIAEAGGGIRSSLKGVREASREELTQHVRRAFDEMAAYGTTTVEAKSGYGLSFESELNSLEAIRDAAANWAGTVVPTLLGAHVVPPEYREQPDEYVRLMCEEMIPAVVGKQVPSLARNDDNGREQQIPRDLKSARDDKSRRPKGNPEDVPLEDGRDRLADFVDVFCERGAFSLEQTLRILRAATEHGLRTRIHVCQLTPCELSPLLEFHPASLDHMDHVSDADIAVLAKSDTTATLLPAANYFLGLKTFPPARKLIDAGVAVALATDYNPGTSPTTSMPFVLSAACTQMKMSPAEAIVAATFNGACALRLVRRKGSLEPSKDADLAIFDATDYRELAYWIGGNRCVRTIMCGRSVTVTSALGVND